MRPLTVWIVVSLLLLAPLAAAEEREWVQLDDPPPHDAHPAIPDPADMVDLFYAANATHAFFRMDLAAAPEVETHTYAVYLDKPTDNEYEEDYRLIYAASGAYLETWDGEAWVFAEDIGVMVDGVSVIFEVTAEAIGGLGNDHVKVWFETYGGPDSFQDRLDKAPKGGKYVIHRTAIPNLPGIVLPLFAAAILGTAGVLLWRRRVR